MVELVEFAEVHLGGRMIGAVIWDDTRRVATFEYDPDWVP